MNFASIKQMAEKKVVLGLPLVRVPSNPCEGCLVGKQVRNPQPTQTNFRATKRLELVHGDLCGPITPVDDYTRVMWIYLLNTKDETYATFKRFRTLVENETGDKMKVFRTDRGGEFLSKEFENYCDETGLKRHYTAPYTPQQNGVVERRNRTVVEMIRMILKFKVVPKKLWGEAARHAVYVLNRVSMKALNDITPYECWFGRKPNIEHLRVFGCLAHTKIVKGHLRKLEDRSKACVYLGTELGTKAYRLLNPNTGKIIVSKDVCFDEDKGWIWQSSEKFKSNLGSRLIIEGYSDGQYEEAHGDVPYEQMGFNYGDTPSENLSPSEQAQIGIQSSPNEQTQFVDEDSPSEQSPGTPRNSSHTTSSNPNTPQSSIGSNTTTSESTGSGAPKRYRRLSDIYREEEELLLTFDQEEPTTFGEAKRDVEWVKAMKSELSSIERNRTWDLVNLPKGRKAIGLKWVFKLKRDPNGNILKHKARLVAKGYVQKQGIDFDEVFAPVARIETVRVLLALTGKNGWRVHHLDVKSAFLHGKLEEEVYVSQSEGFVNKAKIQMVYKLSKALYGLRQAPRAWNARLDKYLKQIRFTRCVHEYAVYTKKSRDNILIVGVYVDDLIVTRGSQREVNNFKQQMNQEFEMSDFGMLSYYLGIEVAQSENGISLKQTGYAKGLLGKFGMEECNGAETPMEYKMELTKDKEGECVDPTKYRSVVGGLRYLCHTRPDLSYAVGIVSRFLEKPTKLHHQAVKRILRYVKGTLNLGLFYA